ncbi:MAG: hypothetical protein KJ736_05150 [Candidatus Omnitrophica bacterium]|nr:hypothetical protein [Candidatus Omnitrophota bacterium]
MNNIVNKNSLNSNLSSPNALKETIKNDSNVFFWFLIFILNKKIREKLEMSKDIKRRYKKLFFSINILFLISIPSLFSCLHLYLFSRSLPTWILLCLLLSLYFFFRRQIKLTLLIIVNEFIDAGYKEHSFENLSLYQIGEFYASEYKTISIVEFINKRLSLQATVLFISFFYATFIHPINFLTTVLTMAAALFTVDIYFIIIHIWFLQFKTNNLPGSNKEEINAQ